MKEWIYNIGDNVIDEKRNLTITDRQIKYMSHYKKPSHQKWVKYTCNICGWTEGWAREYNIYKEKFGCSCCYGRVIVKGINDLCTTAPHVIPYLLNIEDGYKHTKSSQDRIKTKCPICGDVRDYIINQLTSTPYACHCCGKNFSLPERFFYEFLKAYNIDFIPQLSSAKMKWCGRFRYDFYLIKQKMIVETHGRQHYEKGLYRRSYQDIHEKDIEKIKLAISNNVSYCVIPFIESRKESLIKELMTHEIIDILNIPKEGLYDTLNECFEKVYDNKMKYICDYYNEHPQSIYKIGKALNISTPVVLKALTYGNEYGLCKYNGQEVLKQTRINNNLKISKGVSITDPNGKEYVFKSIREAERMSDDLLGRHFSRFFIKKYCILKNDLDGYFFNYV